MSKTKFITELTPAQEAQIRFYREKWSALALSTRPISHKKALKALKALYAACSLEEPQILFCDSPYAAANICRQLTRQQPSQPSGVRTSTNMLHVQLSNQLDVRLQSRLIPQLEIRPANQRVGKPRSELRSAGQQYVQVFQDYTFGYEFQEYTQLLGFYDFCISVLDCACDEIIWEAFKSVAKYCGWLVYESGKTCVVCARPIFLSFGTEGPLHAEGEPVIQFADGYSEYFYHGVGLPEKYGRLHPHQWQARWLLKEHNAEVRRVLI